MKKQIAGVFAALFCFVTPAHSQVQKNQIVGSWSFVSLENTRPDGTKFDPNGGKPNQGVLMFDNNNRFSWQIIQTDVPKIASNTRTNMTAEEQKAVALGIFAFYGTYSLEEGKTLSLQIENSSFPNFRGVTQKRTVSLNGDDLTVVNPSGASGGSAEVKWKRIK